jgi:hypothetical protein
MPDIPRDPRPKPTDAELEALAQITPADIDAAIAAFNQYAPPNARGLLDAKPEREK